MSENTTPNAPVNPAPAPAPQYAPVQPQVVFDQADVDKNKWIAIFVFIMPYFFFIPMMMEDRRDSEFVKFYVNQIFLCMIFFFMCTLVNIIPILGWIAFAVASVFFLVNWIISIVSICKGKARQFPFFGHIKLVK